MTKEKVRLMGFALFFGFAALKAMAGEGPVHATPSFASLNFDLNVKELLK